VLAYRTLVLNLTKGNPNEYEKIRDGMIRIVCDGPKDASLLGCYVLLELTKQTDMQDLTTQAVTDSLFDHLFSTDLRLKHEATNLLCRILEHASYLSAAISKKIISTLTAGKNNNELTLVCSPNTSRNYYDISGIEHFIAKLIERRHQVADFLIDASIHLLLFDAIIQNHNDPNFKHPEQNYIIDTMKELCNVLRKILQRKSEVGVEESILKAVGSKCLEVIKSNQDFDIETLLNMQDALFEKDTDRYILGH
jgi:hypothetical protein